MLNLENFYVNALDCKQTDPAFPDCVVTVHYSFVKTEGEFQGSTYGTVSLSEPEGSFTPFEDLTKEQIFSWCNFDLDCIEAALDSQIEQQKNPPVVSKPAPF